QELLRALDQGAELVQGTSSYVYLGARVIRGWAIELVLIAALLPFVIATIDLFARCRRRRLPIAPALRSYRSRLAFWIWVGVVFTNPFALILVLPSLHAWLWLPQVQSRPAWLRASVLALGFLGPVVLVISFATRYGLGLDAPWYLAELVAVRYVTIPTFVIGL